MLLVLMCILIRKAGFKWCGIRPLTSTIAISPHGTFDSLRIAFPILETWNA